MCTSWGIVGAHVYLLYLLDVLRRRLEFPELRRAVRDQQQRFAANVVLIEDQASGTQLIQDLVHEGLSAVTRYQPRGDKVMRMHAQTAMIENGFVHLPAEAPWLAEYRHELTSFPHGRHDDQVDATAQFLDWFQGAGREPGIIGYYRWLIEERRRKAEAQPASAPASMASRSEFGGMGEMTRETLEMLERHRTGFVNFLRTR